MIVKYLGTGAAEGVPAMFCCCDFCNKIRGLGVAEYRTRSQVLIDGILSVDFPPEAFSHSLNYGFSLSSLKYVFVTHSHMDHFYAHDFILRGYKYAKLDEDVLRIYGNGEVEKVFNECTRREMKPTVSPHLSFERLKPYQVLQTGEYRIITIPANHCKNEDALLYYIERGGKGYLHLYDTGRIDLRAVEFLARNGAKVNLVSFDCTFGEGEGGDASRHMGIVDNMVLKEQLQNAKIADDKTRLVITHFSHNCNPTRDNLHIIEERFGVTAAYDGMEICI